jgi:uncharacterized protein
MLVDMDHELISSLPPLEAELAMPKTASRLWRSSILAGCLAALACFAGSPRAAAQGDDLIRAASAGDLTRVKALIDANINVNAADRFRNTALIMASLNGHLDVVHALLGAKANVNAANVNGATALTVAALDGHADIVQALLSAGADVNARLSNMSVSQDNRGTPLMFAAMLGHVDVVRVLLAAGADVHAVNAGGDTASSLAAENGHQDIVQLLKSASLATLTPVSPDDELLAAVERGDLARTQALLATNVNVNARNVRGFTALEWAASYGSLEIVEALLARGADVNLARGVNPATNILDRSCSQTTDETALIDASDKGYEGIVRALLAAHADANARDCHGRTALIFASSKNHADVVKLLLAAGAEVNAADNSGTTALKWADLSHAHNVKKLLKDAGGH